ncbi:hypothetical protein DINM_001457 [Dirofilaria immitis]|nr:hypothetical protein [Dirofilaria immitis]
MEAICNNSASVYSGIINTEASTVFDGDKPERSQTVEDENERLDNQLLEEVLDRLEIKNYDEVHSLIIAATDHEIASIYRQLFQAIINEYDNDFVENGISDPILENVLLLIKSYGVTKEKLPMFLQCSDRISSWKAFIMLGNFVEEILPELKDLNECFARDIREVYIPSWMERFEKSVTLNYSNDQLNRDYLSDLETDYLNDDYNPPLPDFLSMSKNYELLDELFDKVLACTHIQSHFLEALILKLDAIYRFSDRSLPLNTLIFVNSFKARFCSLPRVFSPEYYLKLAISPLRYSLHISTSNMFNIGYVVLVLRSCLISIENESIGRNQWMFFLEFLADFLICCEECTLCKIRVACMDTFKMFLSKFEPIAQVLIIRKLFNMIRKNEIQRKNLHKANIYDEKSTWLFWGDLVSIRYSCLSDGLQYYLSLFVLAQEQALRRMNAELMLNIYKQYLQPLQLQISDWVALVEAQERQMSHGSLEVPADQLTANMKRLEMETRQQQDSQSLPLLQFQYLQTLNFVTTFLQSVHML